MTRALPTRSLCVVLTAAAVLACTAWPLKRRPHVAAPVPVNVLAADSLALRHGDTMAFRTWARGATLDELMYLLRHMPAELAPPYEAIAASAALARVPADRAELHALLAARVAAAVAKTKRGVAPPAAPAMPSAYRVALLLPERGDHAMDATAFEAGFRVGLESRAVRRRPPIEVARQSTADDAPAAVAAAFDAEAPRAALVCGGFARDAALVLAAEGRAHGMPLLLAANDDPVPVAIAPHAWLTAPAAAARGRALARASGVGDGDRVATLVSSAADTAFAAAFAAECRARGATVGLRLGYAPGNASFVAESHALQRERAGLLFWDGDPNEAAALLRQLTRDRVSLRLCGGDGLDPSRHHKETRVFLEGVRWAGADWVLADSARAGLDRALGDAAPAGPMHGRGWLAGRAAGAALAGGGYTPGEVAAALSRVGDAPALGAVLPVWIVREGRSEPATAQ